jgi:hypothetical protein
VRGQHHRDGSSSDRAAFSNRRRAYRMSFLTLSSIWVLVTAVGRLRQPHERWAGRGRSS